MNCRVTALYPRPKGARFYGDFDKKPTTSDFMAIAKLPSAEQLAQVQQSLIRKKRARITISIEIHDQQGMTVQQVADYVIWVV